MSPLLIATDLAEKLLLFLLLGLSIWSLAIILERRKFFQSQLKVSQLDLAKDFLSRGQRLPEDQVGSVFFAAYQQIVSRSHSPDSLDRWISSFVKAEKQKLEKGLAVLATLGANAPFLGLLGTVLGVIRAFAFLGNQAGSAAVMTGVSQALYATAVGLFVAIPAVVAFNFFSLKVRTVIQEIEALRDFAIYLKSQAD